MYTAAMVNHLNFFLFPSVSLSMAPARPPMDLAWLGNTINPGGGALGLAGVDMKLLDQNRFACMARACRVCDGLLRKCNRSAFMMVCSTL